MYISMYGISAFQSLTTLLTKEINNMCNTYFRISPDISLYILNVPNENLQLIINNDNTTTTMPPHVKR